MERSDKDYAIEFGEYLATAADDFMREQNRFSALELDGDDTQADRDAQSDAWKRLQNAVYEFRKRATRAGHEPSATKFNR
jgi:hypothetical protein